MRHLLITRKFRRFASTSPALHFALGRVTGNRVLAKADANLIIDGFPRSGNSLAEASIRVSQADSFRVYSHAHAPAQVIKGVSWGVPTVVLLRHPVDAVGSFYEASDARWPVVEAFKDYTSYYEAIENLRSGFLIWHFDEVVSEFGSLLCSLNEKFGSGVVESQLGVNFSERVKAMQDEMSLARVGRVERYSPVHGEEELRLRQVRRIEARKVVEIAESSDEAQRSLAIYDRLMRSRGTSYALS